MSRILITLGLMLLMALPASVYADEHGDVVEVPFAGTGAITVSDNGAMSNRLNYDIKGVTRLGAEQAYEGWMMNSLTDELVSTGVMAVTPDGNIMHTWNTPDDGNIFEKHYDTVKITVEPVPDDDAAPSNMLAYSFTIPEHTFIHTQHLISHGPHPGEEGHLHAGDPERDGLLVELQKELAAAIAKAQEAQQADSLDGLKAATREVIDMIDKEDGILRHEQSIHTELLAEASYDPVVTKNIALIDEYDSNAEMWTIAADDQAKAILDESNLEVAKTLLNIVIGNLQAAKSGTAAGAGGIDQAYVAAHNIATFSVPAPVAVVSEVKGDIDQLPQPGDDSVPGLAQIGALAALALILGGGALMYRERRQGV